MGASVDYVPALSSLGRVVWVINTTTDALSPRMVRTYSGFWPRRLLHRRRSLRTCRSPAGQENWKVWNAKSDHLISQETVAAPNRQQEQETLNGSSTGFKNQPNLPKFGGFGGGYFFKSWHCSRKKSALFQQKMVLFIQNSVKKSESTRSDFFQPAKFLNTGLLLISRETFRGR
jgi:hypothetical protein